MLHDSARGCVASRLDASQPTWPATCSGMAQCLLHLSHLRPWWVWEIRSLAGLVISLTGVLQKHANVGPPGYDLADVRS